jgi:hypothetical protein
VRVAEPPQAVAELVVFASKEPELAVGGCEVAFGARETLAKSAGVGNSASAAQQTFEFVVAHAGSYIGCRELAGDLGIVARNWRPGRTVGAHRGPSAASGPGTGPENAPVSMSVRLRIGR